MCAEHISSARCSSVLSASSPPNVAGASPLATLPPYPLSSCALLPVPHAVCPLLPCEPPSWRSALCYPVSTLEGIH